MKSLNAHFKVQSSVQSPVEGSQRSFQSPKFIPTFISRSIDAYDPAAPAAARGAASRRQKASKTVSAYLYFEFTPPDGRAKLQTGTTIFSGRVAGLHAAKRVATGAGTRASDRAAQFGFASRVRTSLRPPARPDRLQGVSRQSRAAVKRCELKIKIRRSGFTRLLTT